MTAHSGVREDLDFCRARVSAGRLDDLEAKEAARERHRHYVRVEAVAGGERPVPSATVDDYGERSRDRRTVRHLTCDKGDAGDLALSSEVDLDEGPITVFG